MKKPKISNLKENTVLTKKIRTMAKNVKEIKVSYVLENDFMSKIQNKINKIENELLLLKSIVKKAA